MNIIPTHKILGARIESLDLAQPLGKAEFGTLLEALGKYGVLSFPGQKLEALALKRFSEKFGDLQLGVSKDATVKNIPEVMVLSNIVENGKAIGLADAGQDWHTDMSYNPTVGFVNVLYGKVIPHRDGKPLGATRFANMQAAYEDLPDDLKARLANMTARHDFNKFWEGMRARPGSTRPALTAAQRADKPPSTHPIFLTHPITGKKILYANPGYATRINELDEDESDRILDFLFRHQLQDKYQYEHRWTAGDVLMWDHIGTLHFAVPDYRPDEHRLIERCQVMATRIFDPDWVRSALSGIGDRTAAQ